MAQRKTTRWKSSITNIPKLEIIPQGLFAFIHISLKKGDATHSFGAFDFKLPVPVSCTLSSE